MSRWGIYGVPTSFPTAIAPLPARTASMTRRRAVRFGMPLASVVALVHHIHTYRHGVTMTPMHHRRLLLLALTAAVVVGASAWVFWPRTAITRKNAAIVQPGMTLRK